MKVASIEIQAGQTTDGAPILVVATEDNEFRFTSVLDAISCACDCVPADSAEVSCILIEKDAAHLIASSINARSPMHKVFTVDDFQPHMVSDVQHEDGRFNYTVMPAHELHGAIDNAEDWIREYCKEHNIPAIGRVDKDGRVTPR